MDVLRHRIQIENPLHYTSDNVWGLVQSGDVKLNSGFHLQLYCLKVEESHNKTDVLWSFASAKAIRFMSLLL